LEEDNLKREIDARDTSTSKQEIYPRRKTIDRRLFEERNHERDTYPIYNGEQTEIRLSH